ncbi:MAG: thiol reductant ABC exporter subunit CydC [Acidobacteria bacterium]|nr:thiol reductant ABC exporter subunit CydC [Acidobacteriota bacterium]
MTALRRLGGRLFEAGFGPGGIRTLAVIGALSVIRAVAFVLIAESLAGSIAAIANGTGGWREATVIGAVGVLLRAGSSWAIGTISVRHAIREKSRLRTQVAERALRGGADSGEVAVLATTGLDDLDDYFGSVIPAAISAVVVPVVLGARILSVDWLSALIVALALPLVPLFMILIGMHTRDRTDAAAGELSRLANYLVELARGLPVIVGLGRVEEQSRALDGIQRELRRRTSTALRVAFLSALALELIATLSVALVAVTLGIRLLSGNVDLGTALLVLLLAPDCFGALREVGTAFHAAQDGTAALRRVKQLVMDVPARLGGTFADQVVVSDLAVSYDDRSEPALRQLSATFPRGAVTAVVGASGAGKSTLLAAIADDLGSGSRVSGRIRGVDPLRMAVAAQAPAFFGTTVRTELELAAGLDSDVDAAMASLGLGALAESRPSELSPGEARRLAIARALLRVDAGATTLLLDEPTAHLDEENVARVIEALRSLPPAVVTIVVTHDPAVIELADRIVAIPAPVNERASAARPVAPAAPEPPAPANTRAPEMTPTAAAPTLVALFRAAAWRWALAIGLGVIATALGLALTSVSAWLIVRAAEHPAIMYLLVAIVGVRFFGLGRSVARYAERLVTHSAVFAASDAIRLRVWAAIAARGAGARRLREGGGAIDYLVTSLDTLRELLPRVVVSILVGALSMVGVIVTVALVDPAAAPLVAVVLTGVAISAVLLSRRAERAAGAERIAARGQLVVVTASLADAASDLRSNGLGPRVLREFGAADHRLAELDRRASWSAGLGAAVMSWGTAGLAILLPAWSMSAGASASASAETVAVVSLLVLASLDPLTELFGGIQRAPALRAVLAHLRPFLVAAPAESADRSISDRIDSVHLDSLAAQWPDAPLPVFHDVTGEIPRGRWLIVDGPSGSGKTTLLTLLLGALRPSSGHILVDGMSLTTVTKSDWRRRIAWAPQEAHVFDSTIRGNLLLARDHDDRPEDSELLAVLDRVGLGPLLARSAEGLDTRVGVSGGSLSGGERQRLAVARALLGRAEILLLDEPTAHLDEATAAAMMADLRAAASDRFVVLVTHRLTDRHPDDDVIELRSRTEARAR